MVIRSGLLGVLVLTVPAVLALGRRPAPDGPPPATLEVTLTEGTNVAAAPSPDGTTLALDLQGRIWLLPADGGEARALTDPLGDARQPSWTPDGRTVVFQAYWTGTYHLWAVDAAGGPPRQLTFGPFDDREPHVSPDGGRVVFSSDRGGSYDVWELELASETLRRLTDDPADEYAPSYAPDGRRVAFVSEREGAEGVWLRDADGRAAQVLALPGDLGPPALAPDGARLAVTRIQDGRAELLVAPLSGDGAGQPRRISGEDEDVFGFRPAWLPGGDLLYTGDGRVRRRPAAGGAARDVPFRATVVLERPAYPERVRDFGPADGLPVRGIVSPAVSPDGSRVAFAALGDLWTVPVAGGPPTRLTDDVYAETDPAWSPDGTRLAYASDRSGTLDLWVRDLATGSERRLTTEPGAEAAPAWSPDGRRIAFLQGGRGAETGVKVVDVASGAVTMVRSGLSEPGRPTWSPDGRQLAVSAFRPYSGRFREGVNRILLLPLRAAASDDAPLGGGDAAPADAPGGPSTGDPAGAVVPDRSTLRPRPQLQERVLDVLPHTSLGTRGTDGPTWSPDGRWMAFVSGGFLWALPVTPDGDPAGPVRQLSTELADDPSWTGDSERIVYLTADRLVEVALDDGARREVRVDLTWSRSVPRERYTVHAGRLWDGLAPSLARDRDIVVEANRIVRVTDHDPALHQGRVVDAGTGVVMPGIIEMHTHQGPGEEIGRVWLSYGVTSVRETAGDPYGGRERVEAGGAGVRIGPRTFFTGGNIDGARVYYGGTTALESPLQVDLEMERAALLDYDLVKTYVRLSDPVMARIVRQAHALGLPVTSHELYPAVGFGADGVEHVRGTSRRGYSPKVSALNRSYADVVELLAASGMALTPTVGIYGGFALLASEDPGILDDPRVRTFFPWAAEQFGRPAGGGGPGGGMDPERRRRLVSAMAGTARRVAEAGGRVIAGTDAPINPMGLSLVAELEILVRYGGMRPYDALRSATALAAEALGAGADLGTVEAGKLADLVVLEGDPLADITQTRRVRTVIADGRVHTLDALLRRP